VSSDTNYVEWQCISMGAHDWKYIWQSLRLCKRCRRMEQACQDSSATGPIGWMHMRAPFEPMEEHPSEAETFTR